MVFKPKPPTSVRSIRLTDELWATIAADAEARGEKVNAVVARHLRIAYAPKDKLTVQRIVDETMLSPLGARVAKSVAAQDKADAVIRTALGERLQRKTFNPQPKKGKAK